MKLRTILTGAMLGVGALATVAAIALIVLTSALHESTVRLTGGMQRVRLLMELEADTLRYVQGTSRAGARPPSALIERLRETGDEALRADLQRLEGMIDAAAAASTAAERETRLGAAVGALRSLVAREEEAAQRAVAASAAWDRTANVTAAMALVLLVVGVGAVLAWLWRSAFEPLVATIDEIERFAGGDRSARAVERGPEEIQHVAASFNGMAASLARQRDQQLAFIGGVAHDLRNPLAALHGAVGLLDVPQSDPARVRERIRRQVERLEQMTGDLLDRTRIEADRFELHLQDTDLREIVARATDGQRDSEPMRPFAVSVPPDPVVVNCDPLRIEQILNNLLSNASKYSPESSEIEVDLERDDAFATVSVTDRGIGISPADSTRIFEPFRRGANVGRIGGVGLGLSVTKKLVEAHSGTIEVRSEPGKGSVFVVRLPLAGEGR